MKKRYLLCSTLILGAIFGFDAQAGVYDLGGSGDLDFSSSNSGGNDDPCKDSGTPQCTTSGCLFVMQGGCTCDASKYPLTMSNNDTIERLDSVGEADKCKDQYGIHYCYKSCKEGYTLSGCDCVANSCSGYTYPTANIPGCIDVNACTNPQGTKYKCGKCAEPAWVLNSDGGCTPKKCNPNKYPYEQKPDSCLEPTECTEHVLSNDGLRYDTKTKYGCEKCKDGWVLDEKGYCDLQECGMMYNLDSCPENATCTSCTSGSVTKYKLEGCLEGYELKDGKCVAITCDEGYTGISVRCMSGKCNM